jgi:hypothetical protein
MARHGPYPVTYNAPSMKSAFPHLVIIILFITGKVAAQGNLLITPVRVVFEGQKKMQELNLANTGPDSAKYVISLMEIRMNEDGTFDMINQPDSGQNFASPFLRYFPRTVYLAPGEAQLIKVQLTKTNQLKPGEYRSHIYFRAVPDEKPLGEQLPAADTNGISVKLTPVFGITIPVIIHVGTADTKVTLSDLALHEHRLNVTFNRTGNFSVYGDVTVNYISLNGKIKKVGNVNGIAVYTPNAIRHFHIDLDDDKTINYHQGKLQIIFTTKTYGSATGSELSSTELPLQ